MLGADFAHPFCDGFGLLGFDAGGLEIAATAIGLMVVAVIGALSGGRRTLPCRCGGAAEQSLPVGGILVSCRAPRYRERRRRACPFRAGDIGRAGSGDWPSPC